MAGLLISVRDADLRDAELPKLEAKAAREARRRAEHLWHVAFLRCWAAKHDHDAEDKRRILVSPILG